MRRNFSHPKLGLVAALLCSVALTPGTSMAQTAPQNTAVDEFGFDLLQMQVNVNAVPDVVIGSGSGALDYSREGLTAGYDLSSYFVFPDWPNSNDQIVNLGSRSIRMVGTYSNGAWSWTDSTGEGHFFDSNGLFVTPDGTKYEFAWGTGTMEQNDTAALLSKIIRPDGRIIKVNWTQYLYPFWDGEFTYTTYFDRIQSVDNNFGNILKFDYQSDVEPIFDANWLNLSTVTGSNQAIEYCDPNSDNCSTSSSSNNWPKTVFTRPNADTLVVSSMGRGDRTYANVYSGWTGSYTVSGAAGENIQMTWNGYTRSITREGRSATYQIAGNVVTRTETGGAATIFTLGPVGGVYSRTESVKDPLNRTTSYQYDSFGRTTRVTYPEGNYVQYAYDSRGNVTETRQVSKTPGTPPDIVLTAGFDATCTILAKCNKPNWTKDAAGNQTDYTYDPVHGGTLTVTAPAPAAGQPRPQVRYSYAQKQAYYKDATGQIVASGQPIHMLTAVSSCQNNASCTGQAEEQKVSLDYGPQVAGTPNNLLPISATVSNGTGTITQTKAFSYNNRGDVTAIDGPLPGSADTTAIRYDAARRQIGSIAPDPDGTGALVNMAERTTIDLQGQVTKQEVGTTIGQTDVAWSGFAPAQAVETAYDSSDRPTTQTVKAGGTSYQLAQKSYDANGRVECVATRMNPAAYASLPTSACTQSTAGTQGADRITKTAYDAAGQVTQVTSSFGQPEQAAEVIAYTNNGKPAYIVDGESNRTTYEYDGHDRLAKTRYPVASQGANASSTTDFQQLTYNSNSQISNLRLRDGRNVINTYDYLGRLTFQDRPVGELDWSANYDLANRPTFIQDSGGTSVNYTYNALGQQRTETSTFGTFTKDYDVAGRLTKLAYPDGFFVNYDYDTAGSVTKIRENGATTGLGVLATYNYDSLGRRTTVTRGNGTVTSYDFDVVSRLISLGQDLSGSANDLTIGSISYNSASQIMSQVKSNDAYAWAGHYNVNRGYTVNGLNQMITAGATALGYDSRGNLTTSGSNTYGYDSLNRLISGPGTTLSYDPLDRLRQVVGASGTTRFGYAGNQLLIETNGTGVLTRRYVAGPGTDEPLVWYEGSTTTDRRWLHADERGSVIAVSNGSGAMLNINRYDEYGIPQASNAGRFGYTGQTWITELGMWNYKARVYSPTLGRFMQIDPIGYGDGLNWYNYVGGDPVNANDPLGLELKRNCLGVDGHMRCGYKWLPPIGSRWSHGWPSGGYRFGDDQDRNERARSYFRFGRGDGGHTYTVPRTKVCDASKHRCDIARVNSEVCVLPGGRSTKRIKSGAIYPVYSSQLHSRVPEGFVRTTSSPTGRSFVNTTTLFHPLAGTVTRTFTQGGDGSIYVETLGQGDAFLPTDWINEQVGPSVFSGQNSSCREYLEGRSHEM